MFGLFKKKKKALVLYDFDGNALKEGDLVESMRYDLGDCRLEVHDGSYAYVATDSGEKVSWLKMIDASTERQKVLLKEMP